MAKPGMTVSRWIDGGDREERAIDQDPNLRAVFFWGHAPNSQTRGSGDDRGDEEARPAWWCSIPIRRRRAAMFAMVRKDGAYLLPAATQFETEGSATAPTARCSGARR